MKITNLKVKTIVVPALTATLICGPTGVLPTGSYIFADSNKAITRENQVAKKHLLFDEYNEDNSIKYSSFVQNVGKKDEGFTVDFGFNDPEIKTASTLDLFLNENGEIIKVSNVVSKRFKEEISLDNIMKNFDRFSDLVINKGVSVEIKCGNPYATKETYSTNIIRINKDAIAVKHSKVTDLRDYSDINSRYEFEDEYYIYDINGKDVTNYFNIDEEAKAGIEKMFTANTEAIQARSAFVAPPTSNSSVKFIPYYNVLAYSRTNKISEKSLAKILDATKKPLQLTVYEDSETHDLIANDCNHKYDDDKISNYTEFTIKPEKKNKLVEGLASVFGNKAIKVIVEQRDSSTCKITKFNKEFDFLKAGTKTLEL